MNDTIHVVCRHCTHEVIHRSWRDAAEDATDHARENENHAVTYGRIEQ